MGCIQDMYYGDVAAYYDRDAASFEARYANNLVLRRLRDDFRRVTAPHARGTLLEVGCGPGFDLEYWARRCPDSLVYGIDLSPAMVHLARKRVTESGLRNVRLAVATVEDVQAVFPGVSFDLVYSYFGALNTTRDVGVSASALCRVMARDGVILFTVVNKWYLVDMVYECLRLRFSRAFSRLNPVWGGYAPGKQLASRCLAPSNIRRSFGSFFSVVTRRGYCLLYPAWYRKSRWVRGHPRLCDILWKIDGLLNRTPLWAMGEYALYGLRVRHRSR